MRRFTGPAGRLPQNRATFMLSRFGERPGGEDGAGQTQLSHLRREPACRRTRSPSRPGEPGGSPRARLGTPHQLSPPAGGKGEQDLCCQGSIRSPLPYPVFVLADLLHLKSLGTLALGHLPGDLPSPTREVRDQDFGSLPQYKALLG